MSVYKEFSLMLSRPACRSGAEKVIALPPIELCVRFSDWNELAKSIEHGGCTKSFDASAYGLQLLEESVLSVIFEHVKSLGASGIHSGSSWKLAGLTEKIEALLDDYVSVMPVITGKEGDRVKLAAAAMRSDFVQVTFDKKSVAILREQLVTYAEQAPNAPKHIDAISYLLYRMDALLDDEGYSAIGPSDF